MEELKTYQDAFNKGVLDLADNLASVCPTSLISENRSLIKTMINQYPEKIIGLFIVYILKYKSQIDSGDETFFMSNDYSDATGGDPETIKSIFEFKTTWKLLSPQNKSIVKQYMQYLCFLAQNYFMHMRV